MIFVGLLPSWIFAIFTIVIFILCWCTLKWAEAEDLEDYEEYVRVRTMRAEATEATLSDFLHLEDEDNEWWEWKRHRD